MNINVPVNKAAVVADFIAQVKAPFWAVVAGNGSRWGAENTPWAWHSVNSHLGGDSSAPDDFSSNQGHRLLGTRNSEPDPVWPAYEDGGIGISATTNAFFILHSFALKLTRHRQANCFFMRYG